MISELKIKEIQVCDRPREKFYSRGASSLSDLELLALAIGSGSRRIGVMELAAKVLKYINSSPIPLSSASLSTIDGMGKVKASSLLAAFEFAKRRIVPSGVIIRSANDAYLLLKHLSQEKQEHFICISINGEGAAIAVRVVTIGLVNKTQVHPREVFADPIVDRAASIIVAHNHPSGSLTPSEQDKEVTNILAESGRLLGIPLLDHLIFSSKGYFSFQEKGLISSF